MIVEENLEVIERLKEENIELRREMEDIKETLKKTKVLYEAMENPEELAKIIKK